MKKIIGIISVINLFLLPITLFFAYNNLEVLLNKKYYKLNKVKITGLVDVTDFGEYDAQKRTRIEYQFGVDSLYTGKVTIVENSKEFKHFNSLRAEGDVFEAFGYKTNAIIGDEIWVWHNEKGKDLYAFGKSDQLNFSVYILKLVFSILLILLGIWFILNEKKFREKLIPIKKRKNYKQNTEELNPIKYKNLLTEKDYKKVRIKSLISNLAILISFIFCSLSVYYIGIGLSFLQVIFFLLFILTFCAVISRLYYNYPRKDLKDKIKITTEIKVSKKRINQDSGSGPDSTGSGTKYIIEFDEDNDIKEYYINYKYFNEIKIGDVIKLEYSKNANIILKITWNGIDIENKGYLHLK